MSSCKYSYKRYNDAEDINKAKGIGNKYLNFYMQNNIDSLLTYSDSISRDAQVMQKIRKDSLFGNLKSYEFVSGTSNIAGTDEKLEGVFELSYKLNREKKATTFLLQLKYINNKIKVVYQEENNY